MAQVKDWLERRSSRRWLLVVDNADDIDMLYRRRAGNIAANSHRLIDYFPHCSNGSIVLTTRNMKVGRSFVPHETPEHVIKVHQWLPEESERFLSSRLADQDASTHEIISLAALLEHHPLALVQAAAYMCEGSVSPKKYLFLYSQSDDTKVRLLSEEFEDQTRNENIRNPVAATLEISFEYIDYHYPSAAEMLRIISMLDSKAIPESLLAANNRDVKSVIDALGKLQAFCLITKRTDTFMFQEREIDLYDLQSLVRLTLRAWLRARGRSRDAMSLAIKNLSLQYPDADREEWAVYRVYHPHVLLLLQTEPLDRKDESTMLSGESAIPIDDIDVLEALLARKVSWYLRQIGDYAMAEQLARRSLDLVRRTRGFETSLTLDTLLNLAQALEKKGEYEEAKELYKQALGIEERVLLDEELRLRTILSLADVCKSQGSYTEAEACIRYALNVVERSSMQQNISSRELSNIHYNFGALYERQDRTEDARVHFEASYEIRKRALGPEHLDTLRALQGLGLIDFRLGENEKALKSLLTVHKGRVSSDQLGPDHPDTSRTNFYIAGIYQQQNRWTKAEETLRLIVENLTEQLGKDYPHTLEARHDLGYVLKLQSNYSEAKQQYQLALEGRVARLGLDHLQTLDTVHELGIVHERLGSYENGVEFCECAWHGRSKRYGNSDNHTLLSAQAMALALEGAGRYPEAQTLLLQVIDGWEKNSRTRSVDYPQAHQQLVSIYEKLNQGDKVNLLRERLEALKAIAQRRLSSNLGLDSQHLLVLTQEHEYGYVCLQLGQLEEASLHCTRALEGRERRLGLCNEDTLHTLLDLGVVLERQRRNDEVEKLYRCALSIRERVEPGSVLLAAIDHMLGAFYFRRGLPQRAVLSLTLALSARINRLGDNHPDTTSTREILIQSQHMAQSGIH